MTDAPHAPSRPLSLAASWAPELLTMAGVLALAVAFPTYDWQTFQPMGALVVMAMLAVGATFRRAPAVALGILWFTTGLQALTHSPVILAQAVVVALAFGCARYGKLGTVVASGLSIPLAALAALWLWGRDGMPFDALIYEALQGLVVRRDALSLLAVGSFFTLVVPWLLGLLLRALARSRSAEAARDEARAAEATNREIATLREEQAALARDVHDVVGHSLAVILAQAESGQFLGDDVARLKEVLATIATSARASLVDIRHVLGQTGGAEVAAAPGAADALVQGIRAAGREVAVVDSGDPRPLPPELAVVAYRVTQEMLTNAVRHGSDDAPIRLERIWGPMLCLRVANKAPEGGQGHQPGSGLDGMRRRLAAVGGSLATEIQGGTFVATAWMPTGGLR